MPLITDPDDLNQGTEVTFALGLATPTVTLAEAGNLSADGVTPKTIYSFTKEEFRTDAALIPFPLAFVPITDEFFEIGIDPSGNATGLTWGNALSRNLLRRGGWLQRDASGNKTEHWAAISILNAEADDQCYYDIGAGPVDFVYAGNTAEAVQVQSDPNGDGNFADGFDRSANITVFNRQQGQLYSQASSQGNGESNLLAPKVFGFSLNTGTDLNIVASDVTIAGSAPYTGMSITYFSTPQVRSIGGSNFNFGIIIDGNNGTAEQIYEFVQYQLRQNADIDAGAGSVIGQTADLLLNFVGGAGDGSGSLETLTATNPAGGGTGVYIDNFQTADTNRISFTDNTGTARTFPFVSVVTLEFNANLQNDTDAIYRVFFQDANGNAYGTASAILVDDNSGSDVAGNISGAASIQFDFDYDNNVQGGRTAGTDAAIVVVALGLNGSQFVVGTGTIARSTTNVVSLSGSLERQYENAA